MKGVSKMTNFEKIMKEGKQITERDSSEEEIKRCVKNEETQIILYLYRRLDSIKVFYPDKKTYKKLLEINTKIFMSTNSLNFTKYELFASAEIVFLIIHKKNFYIFLGKEDKIKVYAISGRYAVWLEMFTDSNKECIMFEPENEQDICLFDVLPENYIYPEANEYILSKMEERLKRKYENR